jgi:hypothetical protein
MAYVLHKIPLDIILFTREYLYPDWKSIDSCDGLTAEEKFLLEEAKWSWRNFLSMSKNKHWQEVRRHAMIFSLNR